MGDRKNRADEPLRGLSCDEDGVFIAGDVPLIYRRAVGDVDGDTVRPVHELEKLLVSAYGYTQGFSAQVAGLHLVARYMNEGKWVQAKIASVHLRFEDLADDLAVAKLLTAEAGYLSKSCSTCKEKDLRRSQRAVSKLDVSNEPRIPAGQTGGGEWTADGGSTRALTGPLVIPAQAIAPPMPLPMPFDLPVPPTEIAPFPFAVPGEGLKPPLVNPYPNKRRCVKEWEEAREFCEEQKRQGNLKPGYAGYGKDVERCILGQVSAECGGNPTA